MYSYVGVAVHPNKTATKNAVADGTKALTYEMLYAMTSNARNLFAELCELTRDKHGLVEQCFRLLDKMNLDPEGLIAKYLMTFELKLK